MGKRASGGAGAIGAAGECRSYWGAEDMVGNVWEMTANWLATGNGSAAQASPNVWASAGLTTQGVAGLNSLASINTGATPTAPAVPQRGGGSNNLAGPLAIDLFSSPVRSGTGSGFRCARSY